MPVRKCFTMIGPPGKVRVSVKSAPVYIRKNYKWAEGEEAKYKVELDKMKTDRPTMAAKGPIARPSTASSSSSVSIPSASVSKSK